MDLVPDILGETALWVFSLFSKKAGEGRRGRIGGMAGERLDVVVTVPESVMQVARSTRFVCAGTILALALAVIVLALRKRFRRV
jgi:hypothetical protein